MENNHDWEELEQLLASDPEARAVSLGLTAQDMHALERLRALRPWDDPLYTATDMGNSRLFADFYRDTLCFAAQRRCWYWFDGTVWREDPGGLHAAAMARELVRLLEKLSAEIESPDQQKAAWKRLNRLHTLRARQDMLRDARTLHPADMEAFDADPWLLNCLNGTLDLRTQTFRAHRADDMITRLAPVTYDPSAVCPRWESFVQQVTAVPETVQLHMDGQSDPSQEKLDYLQKAVGYALTGDTSRECMFILYGKSTRNGKSTFLETISRMLGDYAAAIHPETLAARTRDAGAPSEDLARLRGKRFVTVAEPENSHQFNASFVKRVTGNDTMSARFLHENSFQYVPQFKIFMNTNHRPAVADDTLFRSGRLKLIPFERHFAEGQQDKNLKTFFARPENLSAVLNWCLAGLRRLQLEGLWEPPCIREAVAGYRLENDWLNQFMQECLSPDETARVRMKQVYAAYAEWSRQNGLQAVNSIAFRKMLGERAEIVRAKAAANGSTALTLKGYLLCKTE